MEPVRRSQAPVQLRPESPAEARAARRVLLVIGAFVLGSAVVVDANFVVNPGGGNADMLFFLGVPFTVIAIAVFAACLVASRTAD